MRSFSVLLVSLLALCAASLPTSTHDLKTASDAGVRMWSPSGYTFSSKDASISFAPGGPITCSGGTCIGSASISSLAVSKITGWEQCGTGKVLSSPDGGVPTCVVPPELDPISVHIGTLPLCASGYSISNNDAGYSCVPAGIYGELYDYESATSLTLTAQNTYYQVTDTNVGSCSGMTCSATTDDITATVDGLYLVNATAGMTLDTNNRVIELKVYKEGTGQDNCAISRKISTGTDQGAASITCLVQMSEGDSLSLYAADMTGTGASLSLEHMNLNAHLVK